MSSEIMYINGDFVEKVLISELPVLVDFYADWCGPCKQMEPVVESIADDYKGRIRVAKVNVDENPDPSAKYGIRGIPTFIIFQDGQVVKQLVGAVSQKDLVSFIDSFVG